MAKVDQPDLPEVISAEEQITQEARKATAEKLQVSELSPETLAQLKAFAETEPERAALLYETANTTQIEKLFDTPDEEVIKSLLIQVDALQSPVQHAGMSIDQWEALLILTATKRTDMLVAYYEKLKYAEIKDEKVRQAIVNHLNQMGVDFDPAIFVPPEMTPEIETEERLREPEQELLIATGSGEAILLEQLGFDPNTPFQEAIQDEIFFDAFMSMICVPIFQETIRAEKLPEMLNIAAQHHPKLFLEYAKGLTNNNEDMLNEAIMIAKEALI